MSSHNVSHTSVNKEIRNKRSLVRANIFRFFFYITCTFQALKALNFVGKCFTVFSSLQRYIISRGGTREIRSFSRARFLFFVALHIRVTRLIFNRVLTSGVREPQSVRIPFPVNVVVGVHDPRIVFERYGEHEKQIE